MVSPLHIIKKRLGNQVAVRKFQFKLPAEGPALREYILGIEIQGILVGDLIYDTYLRFAVRPTIEECDKFLLRTCAQAESMINFWKSFIGEQRPDAIFGSYASYVFHGIPHRVARSMNIPSFTLGGLQNFVEAQLDRPEPRHTAKYWCYPEKLNEIPTGQLANLRRAARKSLAARVKGEKDKSTLYMQKSFTGSRTWDTLRGRRVFLLHDFFDSPHIYRWMLFADFYQWVIESVEYMLANNISFALKPHPNQTPDSQLIIAGLMDRYPDAVWIDPFVPNSVIFEDDPELIVTVYGSVACEAAFARQRVLLAGDNPHISFPKIGFTAQSLDEYWKALAEPQKVERGAPEESVDFFIAHNRASLEKRDESLISYLGISLSQIDGNDDILGRVDVKKFLTERSKEVRDRLRVISPDVG